MQYFTVFIPIHLITLNKPSSSIEGGVKKHFKKKCSDIMYRPPKVRPKSNDLEGGTIPGTIPGTFPWSVIMKKENGVIQLSGILPKYRNKYTKIQHLYLSQSCA